MKSKIIKTLLVILLITLSSSLKAQYYPDADWQIKTPAELKMSSKWIDSAISFATHNENKVDRDLRIADLKAYANEPFYKIVGPVKQRGGPTIL